MNIPLSPELDGTAPPAALPNVGHACARLAASRMQLRLALRGPVTAAAEDGSPPPTRWSSLLDLPGVSLLRDAVRNWWRQHPWYSAGNAAAAAVNGALRPVARRYPWALVAAALLAGGLLGASRPWRWRAQVAAGAAGAMPRMAGEMLATLPMASWLVLLAALTQALAPAAPPAPPAPPAPDTSEPAAAAEAEAEAGP